MLSQKRDSRKKGTAVKKGRNKKTGYIIEDKDKFTVSSKKHFFKRYQYSFRPQQQTRIESGNLTVWLLQVSPYQYQ